MFFGGSLLVLCVRFPPRHTAQEEGGGRREEIGRSEMEAQMPTAEELEWLETHSLLPSSLSLYPPNPTPNPRSSKRPRDEQEQAARLASKSRSNSKSKEDVDTEVDGEEWLRYSAPSSPQVQPPAKTRICISRFASDIPGHCFPITGPHGHRVYAKLNLNPTLPPQHSPAAPALLPQSIHTLYQRIEHNAFSKVLLLFYLLSFFLLSTYLCTFNIFKFGSANAK